MKIKYGTRKTAYGPGVDILLTARETATAITAYLTARGVYINGPRTILVNGKLITKGQIYVDPSGFVITPKGKKISGRGI